MLCLIDTHVRSGRHSWRDQQAIVLDWRGGCEDKRRTQGDSARHSGTIELSPSMICTAPNNFQTLSPSHGRFAATPICPSSSSSFSLPLQSLAADRRASIIGLGWPPAGRCTAGRGRKFPRPALAKPPIGRTRAVQCVTNRPEQRLHLHHLGNCSGSDDAYSVGRINPSTSLRGQSGCRVRSETQQLAGMMLNPARVLAFPGERFPV